MYPYALEKGTKKYTCPSCGKPKRFRRVVKTDTGEYLPDYVGVCDRINSCGYSYTWKEYLRDNPEENERPKQRRPLTPRRGLEFLSRNTGPNFLDSRYVVQSLSNYEINGFIQFTLDLFPNDHGDVWEAASEYLVGTSTNGRTIFWQIDQQRRIRTGKTILYDRRTGKRDRTQNPSWVHAELKKTGELSANFNLETCYFGEHLLEKYPKWPLAIVEAEKTAFLASICKGVFPDLVWLGCGGVTYLNVDALERVGRGRKIVLYPDAGAFEQWEVIAEQARRQRGLNIKVSDLIETGATDAERAAGFDLADYLIREQQAINEWNGDTLEDREIIQAEENARIGEACGQI